MFDLHVVAPSLLAHAALPHLRRSRGAIVNISSTYSHRPNPRAAHYGASKAALEQLTHSWAVELAKLGRGSKGRPYFHWCAGAIHG